MTGTEPPHAQGTPCWASLAASDLDAAQDSTALCWVGGSPRPARGRPVRAGAGRRPPGGRDRRTALPLGPAGRLGHLLRRRQRRRGGPADPRPRDGGGRAARLRAGRTAGGGGGPAGRGLRPLAGPGAARLAELARGRSPGLERTGDPGAGARGRLLPGRVHHRVAGLRQRRAGGGDAGGGRPAGRGLGPCPNRGDPGRTGGSLSRWPTRTRWRGGRWSSAAWSTWPPGTPRTAGSRCSATRRAARRGGPASQN